MAESLKQIHIVALERFKRASDEWSSEKGKQLKDLEFADGIQWDGTIEKQRSGDGRPSLVFNDSAKFIDQIVGEARQNKITIKVHPDEEGDKDVARINEGLIRNILSKSDADVIFIRNLENAVTCGDGGGIRVVAKHELDEIVEGKEYEPDDFFRQVLRIEGIDNPLSVYWDPSSKKKDRSDAMWCFVLTEMSHDEFKQKYGDKKLEDFKSANEISPHWKKEGIIVVAEYWVKVAKDKWIFYVETVDEEGEKHTQILKVNKPSDVPGNMRVIKKRKDKTYDVFRYVMNGVEVIGKKEPWQGKYIPIIPVMGKERNIGGRKSIKGVMRDFKGPAQLFNYQKTTEAELLMLAPRAPYILEQDMITPENRNQWDDLYKRPASYVTYKRIPNAPGLKPERIFPPTIQSGLTESAQQLKEDKRDVTSMPEQRLGEKSNTVSGRAILALQRPSETATFLYGDNLAKSLIHLGRVFVDLIPKKYDTERIIEILGTDDTEEMVKINTPNDPSDEEKTFKKSVNDKYNDLTVGTYNTTVSVGPSHTTKRLEALASMLEYFAIDPEAASISRDLVAGMMDWPGADKFAERFKKTIPPELKERDEEEDNLAQQDIMQRTQEAVEGGGEQQSVEAVQFAQEQEKLMEMAYKTKKTKLEAQKVALEVLQSSPMSMAKAEEMVSLKEGGING